MVDIEEVKYFDKDGVEVGPLTAKTVAVKVIRYTYRDGKLLKHEEFNSAPVPSLRELEDETPSRFTGTEDDIEWEDNARRKTVPSKSPSP